MKAARDTVVSFQYSLDDGSDMPGMSRQQAQPSVVLLGRGQVMAGLEQALLGHASGDCFEATVSPEHGYGPRQEGRIQRVSKKYFSNAARLKSGMTTTLALREGGQRMVTVHKVGMSTIDVDLNHPLAGKSLCFNIEVIDVREATPEELAHGHAHGNNSRGPDAQQ